MTNNSGLRWLRILFAVAVGYLCVAVTGAAEEPLNPEPPVRLKKKPPRAQPAAKEDEKPMEPAQPRVKEKIKDTEEPPARPREKIRDDEPLPGDAPTPREDEAKKTLERIAENIRASEDRLAKKDINEGTRQVQTDIVKDLDSLINQMEQQQSGGGGSSSSSRQQAKGNQKGNPQGGKGGKQKGNQNQQANGGQKNGEKPGQPNKGQGENPGKGGDGATGKMNKIDDIFKGDAWGHLPKKLRMEMDAYGREQFMAKYQDLLRQYYATIAEKGRRRGE